MKERLCFEPFVLKLSASLSRAFFHRLIAKSSSVRRPRKKYKNLAITQALNHQSWLSAAFQVLIK